jgi:Lrp/AsnC family leucine-responsive transcriptional regulator
MSSAQNHRPPLDPTDIAIIEALQDNGRIAISERRIGLSQPATSERVKRLEERGVIAGYGARIDPAALGLGMMAIVRLRTTHENIRACLKQFSEMPQVMEVFRLTGEDCSYVLRQGLRQWVEVAQACAQCRLDVQGWGRSRKTSVIKL